MCRLFGMSAGRERASATFWLLDAPDSLSVQSHREPDGTGLGWFDEHDEPHISKQPLAAFEDRAFAEEGREVRSRTFVAHIRFASTGGLEERNTHPFEQQGRLFAHNGVVEDLDQLDAHLGADASLVKGDTDSERLFALITRETAAAGGDLERGIQTACAWVAANLPVYAINFVLVTADELWALRYPATHDLFVLERAPGTPLAHRSTLGTRVNCRHGEDCPLVVVASERMDDDPGWRLLAPGELLRVSPDLNVHSGVILPDEPAHLLKLGDLSAHAQASQAHTAK